MKTTRPLLCHRVTITRAVPVTDTYGNTTWRIDHSDSQTTTYRGRVWMTAGREEEGHRDQFVETWWVILPPHAQVSHHDRVIWGDHAFDIEAVQPRLGHDRTHHITVRVTHVEGWNAP